MATASMYQDVQTDKADMARYPGKETPIPPTYQDWKTANGWKVNASNLSDLIARTDMTTTDRLDFTGTGLVGSTSTLKVTRTDPATHVQTVIPGWGKNC